MTGDRQKTCRVDGCGRADKLTRTGLCTTHYNRLRKTGRLDIKTDAERFWGRVNKTATCWLWTRSTNSSGYGSFHVGGRPVPAHRFAWELTNGKVPDGLDVDHLCRVRACVNPAHLEPVTRKENILRGFGSPAMNARKTHCKHGHPLSGDNLRASDKSRRRCVTCQNETIKRYMRRVKECALLSTVILTALLQSAIALSFPENVRLGYTSCTSCHVAPTGGGALTTYGRTAGEELATWASEGDGQLFGGLAEQPSWLSIGGDTRYISVRAPGYNHSFLMQSDVELAVQLAPTVWADATVGVYGDKRTEELRRNYILWSPSENITVRGGRFFPAYGIMVPDHTVATRQGVGWQEGSETYNLEIGVHNSWGELTVTDTFEGEEDLQLSTAQGYKIKGNNPGAAVRAAAYVGKTAQVGASYWFHSNQERDELVAGPFVMWGLTRDVYLLSEYDRKRVTATVDPTIPPDVNLSYTELGWEVVRGLHLQATHEFEISNRVGAGLQWFPVPHLELVARAKYQQRLWQSVLMAHYYW